MDDDKNLDAAIHIALFIIIVVGGVIGVIASPSIVGAIIIIMLIWCFAYPFINKK